MKIIEEDKNKSTITTKYVVNDNSIIISVSYDEDGDWQLLDEEEVSEEDVVVIPIQEMVDIDKSLVNLPDLKEGEPAYRKDKESIWLIREQDAIRRVEKNNLVSRAKKVDLSRFKKIEDKWVEALRPPPQKVTIDIKINYDGALTRPCSSNVNYTADGESLSQMIKRRQL